MAAPVVAALGAALAYGGGRTTSSVPVPAGVTNLATDIIIVSLYSDDNVAVTAPSGFTEASNSPVVNATSGGGFTFRVFWKRPTAADAGTYAFTHASTGTVAVAARVSGCIASGNPFDATNSAPSTTNVLTSPAVSLTTLGADRLLFWAGVNYPGSDFAAMSGFTTSSTFDGVAVQSSAKATAGATGSLTATWSPATSGSSSAWLGAIIPTAVAANDPSAIMAFFDFAGPAATGPGSSDPVAPTLPSGRTAYYVAPTGNDSNPGTLAQPWLTIDKAMTQSYTAGDQLLFQRGGTYYGTISKTPTASGSDRFYIGAYGSGPKPVITNAYVLNQSASWSLFATNIWRINLLLSSTHGGWQGLPYSGPNIGLLAENGVYHTVKKNSTGALSAQWEFYTDSTYLYVYSTSNPTTLAPSLIAGPDAILIKVASNTQVTGLDLTNCGGHGIRNNAGENGQATDSNVVITQNHIHHIGGSALIGFADNTVRYGNGVECNTWSQDWLVQGNEIDNCYDVAITAQGMEDCNFTNLRFTQNFLHHNSNNDEWSADGAGVGFVNCIVDDNDMQDGGAGVFAATRANPEYRCCHLRFNITATGKDLKIINNRIKRVTGAYCYHAVGGNGPVVVTFANNDIQLAAGTLMQYGNAATIETAAAWAAAKGTETGSTFKVLP